MADESYKETEDGTILVPLKLAHPMAKVFAERARVDGPAKDYKVGETVWVTREYGNALIDAGMVQVDPLDRETRQKVLLLNKRNMPLAGDELSKAVGEGDAAAGVAPATEKPQSAADAPSAEAKGAKAKSTS